MSLYEKIDELFAPVASDLDNNEAIVISAYENLLGYDDADTMDNSAARIDYWVAKLDSGALTADDFGGAFLEEANTNQGNLISADTFANNQTVVEAHLDAYDADEDTTLDQFIAIADDNRVADEISEDSGTPGETFTLTRNIDVLEGTDDDDRFVGDNNTTSGADSIDGGAGSDTLEVVNQTTLPVIDSIETVILRDFTHDNLDFADTALSDVEDVELRSFTVNDKNLAVTADQSVLLDGVTGAGASIDLTEGVEHTITVVDSGDSSDDIHLDVRSSDSEVLNLTEDGTEESYAKVLNNGSALKTLNLTVNQALTLESVATATTIAAGESIGDITLTSDVNKQDVTLGSGDDTHTVSISDGSGKEFSVDLGSGDDRVVFSLLDAANTFKDDAVTVSGGDGEDTFVAKSALISGLGGLSETNFDKKGVSGFEVVEFSNERGTGTDYDLSNFGATKAVFDFDEADAHTISGITSGFTAEFTSDVDDIGATTDYLTFDLSDKAGSSDELNLVINNDTGDGTFQVEAAGVESISVDASTSDQDNSVGLKAPALESMSLKAGDGDMTVDLTAHDNVATNLSSVDASETAGDGSLTFVADDNAATGVSYTGTDNGDDFTGGAGDDQVVAGSGDDTIDVDAGTGNTIDISSGGDNIIDISTTGKVTVTGFSDGDIIDIEETGDNSEVVQQSPAAAAIDLTNDNTLIASLNASESAVTATGTETITDFTSQVDVAAYLDEGLDVESSEAFTIILNDGTNSYLYDLDVDAEDSPTNQVDAADVTLIGVVNDYVLGPDDVTVS